MAGKKTGDVGDDTGTTTETIGAADVGSLNDTLGAGDDGTTEPAPAGDAPPPPPPAPETDPANPGTPPLDPAPVKLGAEPAKPETTENSQDLGTLVQKILSDGGFVDGVEAIVKNTVVDAATAVSASDSFMAAVKSIVSEALASTVPTPTPVPAPAVDPSVAINDVDVEAQRKAQEAAAQAEAEARAQRVSEAAQAYAKVHAVFDADRDDAREAAELKLRKEGGTLMLADGATFLADQPAWSIPPGSLHWSGGRVILDLRLQPVPSQPPETVTEAWLYNDDAALRCEIPGGLGVGGGRSAELPQSSLIF